MKIWVEQNTEPQTKTKNKPHDYVAPEPEPEPTPVVNDDTNDGGSNDQTNENDDSNNNDSSDDQNDSNSTETSDEPAVIAIISQTIRIDTTMDDWTYYDRSSDFVANMAAGLGID